jgi:hypothetical protein
MKVWVAKSVACGLVGSILLERHSDDKHVHPEPPQFEQPIDASSGFIRTVSGMAQATAFTLSGVAYRVTSAAFTLASGYPYTPTNGLPLIR